MADINKIIKVDIVKIPFNGKYEGAKRCQMKVDSTGVGFYDGDNSRCSRQARYRINKINFCKQHAGNFLIEHHTTESLNES